MLAALKITSSLLKLRIGVAIAASAVAGAAAAQGQALAQWKMAVFTLAVLGASGAAGAFNHYWERDLDTLMPRTRARPFASGRLRPGWAWPLSFAALLCFSLAAVYAVAGVASAVYVFLGAFTYGVIYTVWLKPRTAWNIVIGGLAGSFAVLAGAAAINPAPQTVPILLAVVMFLWTPPHFWSLAAAKRDQYANAGFPMLPVVAPERVWTTVILAHAVLLALLSLTLLAFGMGPLYGAFAAFGGGFFVYRSWLLHRAPSPVAAMANFGASLVQLAALTAGVLFDALAGADLWPA